ncbi:putative 16S rRNA-processing protein RimM [Porphyridium purpureum]|uniref:Putative 16S rRNA-processing protein RimM n=1 Tax=Porphyridium purpureum TaxID=35688 RepID=A0A5J4Z6X1_PORPP|nr:putative 16S rRNA-processing protein RimM [Porphyridium purpureum]|eukprot:POR0806..scf295_1
MLAFLSLCGPAWCSGATLGTRTSSKRCRAADQHDNTSFRLMRQHGRQRAKSGFGCVGFARTMALSAVAVESEQSGPSPGVNRRKKRDAGNNKSSRKTTQPHEQLQLGAEQEVDDGVDDTEEEWTPDKLGFSEICTIIGAHGVRGELRVRSSSDFSKERLTVSSSHSTRYMLLPGRKFPRPVTLVAGRQASQAECWIIKIQGITNREYINQMLRGAKLFVKSTDRPKSLRKNEFLARELEGMDVRMFDTQKFGDGVVGRVSEVITRYEISTGAGSAAAEFGNDLLMVELFDRGPNREATQVWIPFVEQIVPFVDALNREVHIDPPEGLFDVAVVKRSARRIRPRALIPEVARAVMSGPEYPASVMCQVPAGGGKGEARPSVSALIQDILGSSDSVDATAAKHRQDARPHASSFMRVVLDNRALTPSGTAAGASSHNQTQEILNEKESVLIRSIAANVQKRSKKRNLDGSPRRNDT